jgi:outer membrane protein
MKRIIVLFILITNISLADTIFTFHTGVQTWLHDNSGELSLNDRRYRGSEKIDQNNKHDLSLFIAIEHSIPFLPHIKLRQSNLKISHFFESLCGGTGTLPINCFPRPSIDLNHLDTTLYYEISDNWINLDLGLSFLYFNGNVEFNFQESDPINHIDYNEVVTAIYGKAQFALPISGLSTSITANIGTFSSNTIIDFEVAAQYEIGLGFNIETGYRQQIIDFEDIAGSRTESQSKGLFAALNFHF